MADPLQAPYGPTVPQQRIAVQPLDPLARYPGLQAVRGLPTSDEWINDVLNPKRLGTFAGGANLRQLFDSMNPYGYPVNGPRPSLTEPLLFNLRAPRED